MSNDSSIFTVFYITTDNKKIHEKINVLLSLKPTMVCENNGIFKWGLSTKGVIFTKHPLKTLEYIVNILYARVNEVRELRLLGCSAMLNCTWECQTYNADLWLSVELMRKIGELNLDITFDISLTEDPE